MYHMSYQLLDIIGPHPIVSKAGETVWGYGGSGPVFSRHDTVHTYSIDCNLSEIHSRGPDSDQHIRRDTCVCHSQWRTHKLAFSGFRA